jgi:hypothetical protein
MERDRQLPGPFAAKHLNARHAFRQEDGVTPIHGDRVDGL